MDCAELRVEKHEMPDNMTSSRFVATRQEKFLRRPYDYVATGSHVVFVFLRE